jgi:transposase InsO family protein
MPWKKTTPMTERLSVIALYQTRLWRMTERCTRFNISRKTGYKWLRRYSQEGVSGLQEKSRAPLSCPHRIAPEVAAVLLEAKHLHPSWGPRKILPDLERHHPALEGPAASRAGERFRKVGLSRSKPRRRRPPHPGAPTRHAGAPNEVWTADFKGQFRTGDGVYCYPLTVADAYSRYLLGCTARLSTKPVEAQPVFERLFRAYGLPEASRTDNGAPFATPAFCGLSKLRVWWIKLGIRHQRIEPGRPAQNGRHERMHRTLKAEATRPPERNHATPQARFDRCCREYHHERPHEALGQRPPASLFHASPRRMPATLAAPEYPGHGLVRRVSKAGTLRFQSRQLFLRDTLLQEWIALEETGDGIWSIYFYDVLLARVDARDFKLRG